MMSFSQVSYFGSFLTNSRAFFVVLSQNRQQSHSIVHIMVIECTVDSLFSRALTEITRFSDCHVFFKITSEFRKTHYSEVLAGDFLHREYKFSEEIGFFSKIFFHNCESLLQYFAI